MLMVWRKPLSPLSLPLNESVGPSNSLSSPEIACARDWNLIYARAHYSTEVVIKEWPGYEAHLPLSVWEMSDCVVCGGGDFDLLDGLFFCSECGTQSQVNKSRRREWAQ